MLHAAAPGGERPELRPAGRAGVPVSPAAEGRGGRSDARAGGTGDGAGRFGFGRSGPQGSHGRRRQRVHVVRSLYRDFSGVRLAVFARDRPT